MVFLTKKEYDIVKLILSNIYEYAQFSPKTISLKFKISINRATRICWLATKSVRQHKKGQGKRIKVYIAPADEQCSHIVNDTPCNSP